MPQILNLQPATLREQRSTVRIDLALLFSLLIPCLSCFNVLILSDINVTGLLKFYGHIDTFLDQLSEATLSLITLFYSFLVQTLLSSVCSYPPLTLYWHYYIGQLMDICSIQKQLEQFAQERDWDQFHSPKNLVMALAGESGELVEIFQWLTEEQSYSIHENEKMLQMAKEELADVALYLLRLSDKLGIDLEEAIEEKMKINGEKYPIELSKGNATKYNQRD